MEIQTLLKRFCDYSLHIRGYSPATIRRYKHAINAYCKQADISHIEDVSGDNVRNHFFNGRVELKWKSNSYICYHKTLVVFFRWCIENGHMTTNPAMDIEVPKLEKKIPPKLTKQEAMRLLEVVYNYPHKYHFLRYRNYAIFSTFIFAGIRRKELLDLKLTDIDLENKSLFVRQGKGNKDRVVPICDSLAETLGRYLIERQRLNKTCPEFFASLNRNMGFSTTGLKRLVQVIKGASGINFSIHKLRHTFATLMLEGGCDIYSLSRMLGHSDIKTTTIYLAASVEHLRGQMTKHPLNNL
ncbi:tyrosine-type recombinase/integrase [Candidatus Parcubacteria bacterium]|jgi:site-specific recombinase XerD|nr:tyrosine-type recombinase/integrase [Candidatus Parcubacteria bacterium]